MIPRRTPLALAAALVIWCSSCSTTGAGGAPAGAGDPEHAEDADEDRELELRKAELAVAVARIDLAASLRGAQSAVADAERELEDARRELKLFDEHGMPRALDEAQLDLDRALHRRELQADELAELEAMYAEEDFAEMTKELVLKRGKKSLEFAERSLELERRDFAMQQDVELPLERRDLEVAVEEAERALVDAQDELRKVELEGDLELQEAELELEQLKDDEPEPEDEDEDGDGDEDAG